MTRPASLAAVLVLVAVAAGCGDGDGADREPASGGDAAGGDAPADGGGQRGYRVALQPLNDSDAGGSASLSLLGDTLRVQLQGEGFAPGQRHAAGIRRLESGEQGSCPTEEADADGDGTLSEEEAASRYGVPAVELAPVPEADGSGALSFQGTFDVDESLPPLEDRVLVVHDLERDGEQEAWIPVACGEIEEITPG